MGRRVLGHLIDVIVVSAAAIVVLGGVAVVIGPATELAGSSRAPLVTVSWPRALLDSSLVTAVSAAYFVGSWTRRGATVGLGALHLGVRDCRSAARLTSGRAIGRWVLVGGPIGFLLTLLLEQPVAFLVLILVAGAWTTILFVSAMTHPLHRGLHDRASRSIVVRVSSSVER